MITKSYLEAKIKTIFGHENYREEQKEGHFYLRSRDMRVGGYTLEQGYYGHTIVQGKLSEINFFLDGVKYQQKIINNKTE